MIILGGGPDKVELNVADSRTVIPPGQRKQVFEPFYSQRMADVKSRGHLLQSLHARVAVLHEGIPQKVKKAQPPALINVLMIAGAVLDFLIGFFVKSQGRVLVFISPNNSSNETTAKSPSIPKRAVGPLLSWSLRLTNSSFKV